ncbi:Hsp70 ATPase ssc1 [Tulasnella sp. 417]|nr:Hsp70 ATPase ssc1 [Tulasnella sp. 417]
MSVRAAIYHEPALPEILVASSYLYLLNVAGWLVEKTCHAGLVGNIVIGIIYGTPLSGILQPVWEATLWLLGYIGLILIVFEGGLHTDLDLFRENVVLSIVTASTGIAAPIGLTLLLFHFGFHLSLMDSFAAGAALAATSLGTTFAVLESSAPNPKETSSEISTPTDIRHTRIGCTLLAAALIDDILGLVLAAVIPSIRNPDGEHKPLAEAIARPIGVSIALFLLVEISPIRRTLVACLSMVQRQARSRLRLDVISVCTLLIVTTLSGMVAAAHYAGASVLLGAWVTGAMLGEVDRAEKGRHDQELHPTNPQLPEIVSESQSPRTTPSTFLAAFKYHIAPIQNLILAPLFFGAIGTAIPFLDLWTGRIIWRGIIYSVLMVIAKMIVGVWILVWPVTNKGRTQNPNGRSSSIYPALLLAIAMVSRGEISLLIAQLGKLSDEAYQLTMWAILLCTILGPLGTGLLLKWKREECLAGQWG